MMKVTSVEAVITVNLPGVKNPRKGEIISSIHDGITLTIPRDLSSNFHDMLVAGQILSVNFEYLPLEKEERNSV